MLSITQNILNTLLNHAKKELPIEACGYLASKNDVVTTSYPLTNIDKSPTHFSLDPAEQFLAIKQMRKDGEDLIAVYHSHPETPARPSQEDIKLAYDPTLHYVIISLLDDAIKCFRIRNGQVTSEELKVVSDEVL